MPEANKVRPLERRSLAHQIAEQLRELILLEELAPGAPIVERETAGALGVSRTPLRESIRMLAAEGLIEMQPNRVPRVANPSLDELHELLQVQAALEALAGELACRDASDDTLLEIKNRETLLSASSDGSAPLEFFQQDMEFHNAIVAASGNAALEQTHETFNARLWRARFISSRRKVDRSGTLQQHTKIADALLARDAYQTSEALKEHLHTGYENISKARQEQLADI